MHNFTLLAQASYFALMACFTSAYSKSKRHTDTLEAQWPTYWVPVLKTLYSFINICNSRTYYMGTWASRDRQDIFGEYRGTTTGWIFRKCTWPGNLENITDQLRRKTLFFLRRQRCKLLGIDPEMYPKYPGYIASHAFEIQVPNTTILLELTG